MSAPSPDPRAQALAVLPGDAATMIALPEV